jgi:signal transduction histidine kinase
LRRVRIFHTESFRLAALFAALFLGLAGALIAVVYWIVEDTQTAALVNVIDADINTINNGYREKGLEEAVEIVRQRLGSTDYSNVDLPGGYILLQDSLHGKLAGNLASLQPKLGLISLPRPRRVREEHKESESREHSQARDAQTEGLHVEKLRPPRRGIVLGKGVYLAQGVYLFVGRDTATIAAARTRILQAFAWLTGATIILAALGGILFSVQFLRRIDAIARTCNAIVAGRFNDRIPLRGSDDELDRLARAINTMLDRIAALLDNLRQVSSDVAHDLRTPLTHLRQRLEHANVKSRTVEDYSAAVSQAIADTDQLLAIFSALLRISQIEAGTRVAAFSEVSLSELLNRIYEMYRPVAEDRGHVLQREVHDDIKVRGDAELLTQLFVNLIENALRHTPPGTSIRIALDTAPGNAVARICDTGPGIAADEREKVLRRFYRVTTSRSSPGNGLGLALVAAIAKLHQAKIELSDNSPGLCVSIAMTPG